MGGMPDPPAGRFSQHFEYGQPRSVPIEQFPYFRAAVTSDPLELAALDRPQVPEPARGGAGGLDCAGCAASDPESLWTDRHWRVFTFEEPQALFIVLISPREHYEELPDLPPERAAELGPLLARVETALRSLGDVGNVHTHKWGDGGAHLHLWMFIRPLGMLQARGVALPVWSRALPPLPAEAWQAAGRDFAQAMARGGGTAHR
jgi:diadenosine tetraphosphate (Ap4A) HIT family hydrolase